MMMATKELMLQVYLGDGVYAGYDGYQVVLWLQDTGAYGPDAIALEESVIIALGDYVKRIANTPSEEFIPHLRLFNPRLKLL